MSENCAEATNRYRHQLMVMTTQKCDFAPLFSNMAGRAATPQGRKLNNINNMPNRKYRVIKKDCSKLAVQLRNFLIWLCFVGLFDKYLI
jgi:hypothetical protein